MEGIADELLAIGSVGGWRNLDRKDKARFFRLVGGEQIVTRGIIRRNRKPSHERTVGPDGHRNPIDAECGISGSDAPKYEVRIAHGEHLFRLGIDHRDLQRSAHFRDWWKLRICGILSRLTTKFCQH